MAAATACPDDVNVVQDLERFDTRTGNVLERIIFNNRLIIVAVCALLTGLMAWQASRLEINASFEKMMPRSHPFIRNYMATADSLRGLGNSVRIVVENTQRDIYDPHYLEVLRDVNDKIVLLPGVDRAYVKSLWMPVVRWTEITEEGYKGGAVMPDSYNGSQESIDQLRKNVSRSHIIGSLVANDQKSSMLFVPLLETDATGKPLDLRAFRDSVNAIRADYEKRGIRIHVIGFGELVGDLIHGQIEVFRYFLLAALICTAFIFFYTRCVRSTVLVVTCSLVAVLWQLGAMHTVGFVLDPYSILVPFLIFAIGVSHGAQKMNGVMQDVGRGVHRYIAARHTFRRLFLTGLTALVADAVGFAVLAVIDIPVIRGLAIAASIGVAVLIFTNLILLPILLSYAGVSTAAAARSLKATREQVPLTRWLGRFTRRPWAIGVIVVTVVLTGVAIVVGADVKIGDLDPGAPELRPASIYNRDNAYITDHYRLSSDQFAVIVTTPAKYGLVNYETMLEMDRLEEILRDIPGVQTTVSPASLARNYTAASFEGSPKWITLNRDTFLVGAALDYAYDSNPEIVNDGRSIAPIVAYLSDHKAETLTRVVNAVQAYATEHDAAERQFLLAAGSSGIEAATNIAVSKANRTMLLYVYSAVIVLCFITFRNWRAVIVAVVPLMVTSLLAEALMVLLGIGVKVATLPVTALGVGIGVDYSLYLLSVYLVEQRAGLNTADAYCAALSFTGKVVALIGLTLSTAVLTWAWSPIKFQADMGLLLAFMFLWNMLGALILVPSLATFLCKGRSAGREERQVLGTQAAG